MKRILAIGAHPDDIEFGCSGALLKHKDRGDQIHCVVMTSGKSIDGTTGQVIRSEDEYSKELEVSFQHYLECHYTTLPFQDLHLPFSFESISMLEKYIKENNIDTIYTHYHGDANQDHISTFKITMASARYVSNVYCYEQIPIPRLYEEDFVPSLYVDITDFMETKLKMSECHKSQIEKYKTVGFDVIDNLKTMAQYRGIQANCKYAEAFRVIKEVK